MKRAKAIKKEKSAPKTALGIFGTEAATTITLAHYLRTDNKRV